MKQVLERRRIARSLVTVMLLGFIEVIAGPIVAPQIAAPAAHAVDVTYDANTRGLEIVVPAGVESVTITATGGAGGAGGLDSGASGTGSSTVGSVSGTFIVSPGDVIAMYPGGAGGAGASSTNSATSGGKFGASSIETATNNSISPSFKVNGTYSSALFLSGGTGGAAGSGGTSGAGGGGGAASLVAINENVALIAGGGGGGAGGSGATAQDWQNAFTTNGTSTLGADGVRGECSGQTDGGGSGAGGGGYFGGSAGGVDRPAGGECRGTGGAGGGNFVWAAGAISTSDTRVTPTAGAKGQITYTFYYAPVTTCQSTSNVVNIYTVIKVTATKTCTWTVPSTVNVIDLFLVGGGAGGAGDGGVGGNGGAALSRTAVPVTPNSNLSLKVGYGGGAGTWGYRMRAADGDSTTVSTSSGSVLYALGGTGAVGGPSQSRATVATPQAGAFAGGQGGTASTAPNTVGGQGSRGVSNYFYGVQNTYAGGGGGGIYTAATSGAMSGGAGADGGGAGGTENVSGTTSPGSAGTPGTGGGGGGGVASGGVGLRVAGGKGGSGVILIRYATSAADAFPASLAGDVAQRWLPENFQKLDTARLGWIDGSGVNSSSRTTSGTGFSLDTSTIGNASTKSFLTLKGGTTDWVKLANLPSDNKYTLFHVARYQSTSSSGRIFASSTGDWLSGFHNGKNGVASHNVNWLTQSSSGLSATANWLLSTDQNWLYRADGVTKNDNTSVTQSVVNDFGINVLTTQPSSWQVADVIVFNRELTLGEVKVMESYLARIYGLSIAPNDDSSDTDTAIVLDGTDYLYASGNVRISVPDIFTFETWVKAGTQCQSGNYDCYIFTQKSNFGLTIYNGELQYQLQPPTGSAVWVNATGVKFPADEWHHLAVVKDGAANTAGSLKIYVDGVLTYTNPNDPYTGTSIAYDSSKQLSPSGYVSYIGYNQDDTTQKYVGALDELRIWSTARTKNNILSDLQSAATGNESNLLLYVDFNKNSLSSQSYLSNRANNGLAAFDLQVAAGTISYGKIENVTTDSVYTTVTFNRTYISQSGGWRAPSGISRVQAAIIGGGGGAGGGYQGGGGGAGGFIETLTTLVPGNIYPIKVGVGGGGHTVPYGTDNAGVSWATNGETSTAFGFTALGGGYGSHEYDNTVPANVNRSANSGGSGGGGGWSNGLAGAGGGLGTPGQGNAGGTIPGCCTASGGGGAGSAGFDGTLVKGGNGGTGKLSNVLGTMVAAGGGGSVRIDSTTVIQGVGGSSIGGNSAYKANVRVGGTGGATNGKYGTGSGGGAGLSINGSLASYSGSGGAGIVAFKYITALVPTYTKPSNITINVGQTETFTTNVAQDSATVTGVTRTFKWESTTAGANGSFTLLKQGTGAPNASFSWTPSDTSTSGSNYLYRLTVTDSDTAGLFITDSSTAYATINPALVITNTSNTTTLGKTINVSKSETFTITLGTPTYRSVLSPVIAGITLDTATAGLAVLKIGDTVTVGTYYETLTVTDSVSASVVIPLTINIVPPPNLLNTSNIIYDGLIQSYEVGNSASLLLGDGQAATSRTMYDLSGSKKNAVTSGTYDSYACAAPTYKSDFGGYLNLNGTDQCYYTPYFGSDLNLNFSIDVWLRSPTASIPTSSAIFTQSFGTGSRNINLTLGDIAGNGKITVGFWDGTWRYLATYYTPVANAWTHIVGTYDKATLKLYVNGSLFATQAYSGSLSANVNVLGNYIGRRWDSTNFFSGDIASVKIYNKAIDQAAVSANYNATKTRFDSVNRSNLTPSQKYGQAIIDSFTATSGSGSNTFTYAIGDRSGLAWDETVNPGATTLLTFGTLLPGTHYDTVTVTDGYGASTYLPFKISVGKADTITVYVDTPTALSYTGSPAAISTAIISKGLVGFESGTALSGTVKFKPNGATCATGGYCRVGDIGPGGGIVFIDTSTTGVNGLIYEAAPANWAGPDELATVSAYCSNTTSSITTQTGIGWGETNTANALAMCTSGAVQRLRNFNLSNNTGFSNWFIPSQSEANLLGIAEVNTGKVGVFTTSGNYTTGDFGYWTSSEVPSFPNAQYVLFGYRGSWGVGITAQKPKSESSAVMLRPVRTFRSCWAIDTCTAQATTTIPTDSGGYVIMPSALTDLADLKSKYQDVLYANTTLTINKIAQTKQSIPFTYATYPTPYGVTVLDGNGNGALRYSATSGTATNCKFDYRKLVADKGGTCFVTVVRNADRNYFADTATAMIYYLEFVNNQPSGQVGSGSTIGINGVTTFTIESQTVTVGSSSFGAPTVGNIYYFNATCISTLCQPQRWLLYGSGFGAAYNTDVVLKFYRNKPVRMATQSEYSNASVIPIEGYVTSDSLITIYQLPTGWFPGPITVETPYGVAISTTDFDGTGS